MPPELRPCNAERLSSLRNPFVVELQLLMLLLKAVRHAGGASRCPSSADSNSRTGEGRPPSTSIAARMAPKVY